MATEQGFSDRLGRGNQMHTAVASFVPTFAPAFTLLEPANYLAYLTTLDEMNQEVGTLTTNYSSDVAARVNIVKDIKARVLRVRKYIDSNPAWAIHVAGVKRLVDKIRGNRPRKPKPPAAGEDANSPQAKRRNQGEQSYVEIKDNFSQLIGVVGSVTGYAPPATEISITEMQTLATSLEEKNKSMSTLSNAIELKQRERLQGYNGPGGLRELMKAIKKAVAAQYGNSSPEYAQVKTIRL